jgi:hypothetical protein
VINLGTELHLLWGVGFPENDIADNSKLSVVHAMRGSTPITFADPTATAPVAPGVVV